MGLQNSAQSFQRLLDDVLRGLPGLFCYLDDILVFSRTKKDHMKTLEELFKRLAAAGLTLALDKCVFGQEKIQFLFQLANFLGIENATCPNLGYCSLKCFSSSHCKVSLVSPLNFNKLVLCSSEDFWPPKSTPGGFLDDPQRSIKGFFEDPKRAT